MTESVYIESSVISYLAACPSRDVVITARQAITINWWHNHKSEFELFISALVIQEISKGDTDAAQQRLDVIEICLYWKHPWNFKHINNAQTKEKIVSVVESYGFECPVLCSPEELGAEI